VALVSPRGGAQTKRTRTSSSSFKSTEMSVRRCNAAFRGHHCRLPSRICCVLYSLCTLLDQNCGQPCSVNIALSRVSAILQSNYTESFTIHMQMEVKIQLNDSCHHNIIQNNLVTNEMKCSCLSFERKVRPTALKDIVSMRIHAEAQERM
jgi:hypothetical protein